MCCRSGLKYDSIPVDPKLQLKNTLMGCILHVDVAWFYTHEELPRSVRVLVSEPEQADGYLFFCEDNPQRFALRLDDGTITAAGSDFDMFRRKVTVRCAVEDGPRQANPQGLQGLMFDCIHAFREKPVIQYRKFAEVNQRVHSDLFTVPIPLKEGRMLALRLFADGLQVHTTRSFSIGKSYMSESIHREVSDWLPDWLPETIVKCAIDRSHSILQWLYTDLLATCLEQTSTSKN